MERYYWRKIARKYLAISGNCWYFNLVIANVIGIIPGFESPTSNINVNFTFGYYCICIVITMRVLENMVLKSILLILWVLFLF